MKTNEAGLFLISCLEEDYDPNDCRTAAERAVNLYVKPRLNNNQFSTLVCFAMYLDIEAFRKSDMLRLINRGITPETLQTITDQFDKHIYDIDEDGKRFVSPFLVEQRALEKSLFLTPEKICKRRNHGKSKLQS